MNSPTLAEMESAYAGLKEVKKYVAKYWPMCDLTDLESIESELECEIEEMQ